MLRICCIKFNVNSEVDMWEAEEEDWLAFDIIQLVQPGKGHDLRIGD